MTDSKARPKGGLEGIEAADNGEFASDEEMKEMFRKWGADED